MKVEEVRLTEGLVAAGRKLAEVHNLIGTTFSELREQALAENKKLKSALAKAEAKLAKLKGRAKQA